MSSLDVWGLDDVAETAYRAMLRNPDLDLAQLSRHLDLDAEVVSAAVDELRRVGLVSRSGPGLAPASPASTLAALVHVELSDLEERRARLDAVRASLSGFAADHMVGQSRAWSSMPFELLSADESFAAVEDLQRGTTGEVLSSHPVVDIDVDAPTYVELLEHQLAAGRPMRGLYPTGVLDDPARLAYVRRWAEAGETVAPTVRVACRRLPSSDPRPPWCPRVGRGRWLPRRLSRWCVLPALVAMARELFEQYWARGAGLPTTRLEDGDDARPVLELLQLGLKDETIARHLGVSLADRSAAGGDGHGRARCVHPVPGGYGGSATRPDLMGRPDRHRQEGPRVSDQVDVLRRRLEVVIGTPFTEGNALDGPAQRRPDLPGDARGDPRRRAHRRPDDVRLLAGRHRASSSPRRWPSAPRPACGCGCSSTPSAAG